MSKSSTKTTLDLGNPKPFWLLQAMHEKDPRSFRGAVDRLKELDPAIRQQAREIIFQELEDLACLLVLDREAAIERPRAEAQARAAEAEAEKQATLDLWRSASVSNLAGQVAFFKAAGIGVVKALNSNGHVTGNPDPIRAVKSGQQAGLFLGKGFVGICASGGAAEAFKKRFDLPETLSWTGGGLDCWVFSSRNFDQAGQQACCVRGERVHVCAYLPSLNGSSTWMPLASARFLQAPAKALAKDGELPCVPDRLRAVLSAIKGGSGAAVDEVLLG